MPHTDEAATRPRLERRPKGGRLELEESQGGRLELEESQAARNDTSGARGRAPRGDEGEAAVMARVRAAYLAAVKAHSPEFLAAAERGFNTRKRPHYCAWRGVRCKGSVVMKVKFEWQISQEVINALASLRRLFVLQLDSNAELDVSGLDFRPLVRTKTMIISSKMVVGGELKLPESLKVLKMSSSLLQGPIAIDWARLPRLSKCILKGLAGAGAATMQGIDQSGTRRLSLSFNGNDTIRLPRLPGSLEMLDIGSEAPLGTPLEPAGFIWADMRSTRSVYLTKIAVAPAFWHGFGSARQGMTLSVTFPKGMAARAGDTLPDEFMAKPGQLKKLHWSFPEPSATSMPVIPSVESIESLVLRGLRMTRLPHNLAQATRLKTLSVTHSNVTSLPDGIASLSGLQSLDLSHNSIRNISTTVKDFLRARGVAVNTAGNPYVDPEKASVVVLAQTLGHRVSTAKELCRTAANFKFSKRLRCNAAHRITKFHMSGELVSEDLLEALAYYADSLESLMLKGGKLRVFPDRLAHGLTNLTSLDVRSNRLTHPPDTSKMFKLETIRMGDNKIRNVTGMVFASPSIRGIDISANAITELPPAWLTEMHKLETLLASGNQIARVPRHLNMLRHLEVLDISHNMLTDDSWGGRIIAEPFLGLRLDASHNPGITKFPRFATREFRAIDFSGCSIDSVPEDVFAEQLMDYTEVNLSRNKITTLPGALLKNQLYSHLYLDDNLITTLDSDTFLDSRVVQVSLARNRIRNISPPNMRTDVLSLQRQKTDPYLEIDLSFNRLERISGEVEALARMGGLGVLNLIGNDIRDFSGFHVPHELLLRLSDHSLKYVHPVVPSSENTEVFRMLRSGQEIDVALQAFPSIAARIRTLNNDTGGSSVEYSGSEDISSPDRRQECTLWGVTNLGKSIQIESCSCEDGFYRDPADMNRCRPCPGLATCKLDELMCQPGSHSQMLPGDVGDDEPNVICAMCPEGAVCDGMTVVPEEGYWKNSTDSIEVHTCLHREACKGGEDSSCAEGYKGVICGECDRGYFAESAHTCAKCPDATASIVFLALVCLGIGAVGLAFFFVVSSVLQKRNSKEAKRERRMAQLQSMMSEVQSGMAGSLKAAIGFIQVVTSLDMTFDVDWPGSLNLMDAIFGWVNLDIMRATSLECVWELVAASSGGTAGSPGDTVGFGYGQKMALTFCIPLAVTALLLVCYWCVRAMTGIGLVRRNLRLNMAAFKDSCTQTNMLVWQLCYTPLSYRAIQYFNCVTFDGGTTYYIHYDLSTRCYDSSYWTYASTALVAILLYTLGMPLFIAVYGILRNQHIHDESVVGPLVYLYRPYKRQYAYWEALELIRKTIVGGAVVLLAGSATFQVSVALMVMFVFTVGFSWCLPCANNTTNAIQGLMLSLTYFTMSLGVLRTLEVPGHQRSVFSAVVVGLDMLVMALILAMLSYDGLAIVKEKLKKLHCKKRPAGPK